MLVFGTTKIKRAQSTGLPHGGSFHFPALRHFVIPGVFWCFIHLIALAPSCAFSETTPQFIFPETEPQTLRVICHTAMPWVIGNHVAEPLIYVDNDNQFVPCLAQSCRMNDTHMDIMLRKGILFQDGTPFNAGSVVMNWEAYRLTADPYMTIDLRMGIRTIEALSPDQIRLWFKDDGLIGLMPVYLRSFYIYSPAYFKYSQGVYPPGNQANISEPGPWGTGPYQLKELLKNGAVAILERNPAYRQPGYPRIPKVIMVGPQECSSPTAHRLMKLGQADVFDAVPPSMLPLMAQSGNISLVIKNPISSLTTLFNMRKPDSPLRDIQVRKALNLLIDRRTLFKYLARGRALMTAFIFPLSTSGEHLQPYPYQPEEARALLKKAGFDAVHPLVLTIGYFTSEKKTAHAIAGMLEEGGVQVRFQEYLTRYNWYQHVMKYGRGQANPMETETWDLNIVNTGLYTNSAATHFGECFATDGGYRWILPDPRVDFLFLNAMRHRDIKIGEQALLELEKYLYEQYYMMPIYIAPTILAVSKRVAGSSFSSSGYLLNLKEVAIE